jgi:hypothetical protein
MNLRQMESGGGGKFMGRSSDRIDEIKEALLKKRVLSLQWMTEQLGISERSTQRYLKALQTLTSYTHKRQFFTLPDIPRFDHNGIWFCRQIGFSKFGNGLDTIVSFINRSENGFSREELEAILRTGLSKQIQILIQRERVQRIKLGNKYVYIPEAAMQNKQRRLKLVGDRHIEEHFEKAVQKTDLIALLKAALIEKEVGTDSKSIKRLAQKYSLRIPLRRIEQLLLKYDLPEKKTP